MTTNQYLIEIATRSGGIFADTANWTDWANLLIGFIFIALCAWFIWIFYDKKHEWDAARPEFDKHASGTFKGFWARYRLAIVAFMAAVFLILGMTFILFGLFDIAISGYDDLRQLI